MNLITQAVLCATSGLCVSLVTAPALGLAVFTGLLALCLKD